MPGKEGAVMTQITLTEEQMKVLRQAPAPIQVCDPEGNVLGIVHPERSAEFIAEMKRRASAPGARYTGEQVQGHLQALQEAWEREGGFDAARMKEILKEIRGEDKK